MTPADRNALVSANLDTAAQVARAACSRYPGADKAEAEQVALLAMLEKADGYDAARGAPGPYFFRVGLNAVRLALGIKTQDGHMRGRLDVLTLSGRGDMSLVEQGLAAGGLDPEQELAVAQQQAKLATSRFTADELTILRLVEETDGNLRAKMLANRSGLPEARVVAILARLAKVIASVDVSTLAKVGRSPGAARSRRWFANLTPAKREARRTADRDRRAARRAAPVAA